MDDKLSRREERILAEADQREASSETRGQVLSALIWVSFVGSGAVLLIQAAKWLKSGEWSSYTLSTLGVEQSNTSWIGLNKALQFILDLPVALDLLIAGFVFIYIFTRDEHKPIPEELRTARMKRARLKHKQGKVEG